MKKLVYLKLIAVVLISQQLYAQAPQSDLVSYKLDRDCRQLNLQVENKILNGHPSAAISEDLAQPFQALAPAGINTDYKVCEVTMLYSVPGGHRLGVYNTNTASPSLGYYGGINYLYDTDSEFSHRVGWDLTDNAVPYQYHQFAHIGPLFANYYGGDVMKQIPTQWTSCKAHTRTVELRVKIELRTKSSEQNLAKLVFRNVHLRVNTKACPVINPAKPSSHFFVKKDSTIFPGHGEISQWQDYAEKDPSVSVISADELAEEATMERLSKNLVIFKNSGIDTKNPLQDKLILASDKAQKEFEKFKPTSGETFSPNTSPRKTSEKQEKKVIVRGWNPEKKKTPSCLESYEQERKNIVRKLIGGPLAGLGAGAAGAAGGVAYEVLIAAQTAEAIRKGIFLTLGGVASSAAIGAGVLALPAALYTGVNIQRLISLNRTSKLIESAYQGDDASMNKLYKLLKTKELEKSEYPLYLLSEAPSQDRQQCQNEQLAQPALSLTGHEAAHIVQQRESSVQLSVQQTPTKQGHKEILPRLIQALDQSGALCDGSLTLSPKRIGKMAKKGKARSYSHMAKRNNLKKWFAKASKGTPDGTVYPVLDIKVPVNIGGPAAAAAMSSMRNMKGVAISADSNGGTTIKIHKGNVIDIRKLQTTSNPYRNFVLENGSCCLK